MKEKKNRRHRYCWCWLCTGRKKGALPRDFRRVQVGRDERQGSLTADEYVAGQFRRFGIDDNYEWEVWQ